MSIFLLTLPDGSFGSSGQSWSRMNIDKLTSQLSFDVIINTIDNIDSLSLNNNDIVIYTSSENESIRKYLKNSFYFLNSKTNLVPSYKILMAHEDKSFQEVWKKEVGFGDLLGRSLFDIDSNKIHFPKVLKSSAGAGSAGVFLIKNKSEVKDLSRKLKRQGIKRKAIGLQRRLKLSRKQYNIYRYRRRNFNLFVEQEFIPELKHDFKVLVFGDRYFVLRRNVRKNDFRASGSGDFEFAAPPLEVLNYAMHMADILNNPYLSLDIAQSGQGCHLIEFQGTNFGPYTLLNSPYYYIFDGNEWCQKDNNKDLEENYAYALNKYIRDKYE